MIILLFSIAIHSSLAVDDIISWKHVPIPDTQWAPLIAEVLTMTPSPTNLILCISYCQIREHCNIAVQDSTNCQLGNHTNNLGVVTATGSLSGDLIIGKGKIQFHEV